MTSVWGSSFSLERRLGHNFPTVSIPSKKKTFTYSLHSYTLPPAAWAPDYKPKKHRHTHDSSDKVHLSDYLHWNREREGQFG